jgi:putative endonuclease
MSQHKNGEGSRFTALYNFHFLMYCEDYTDINNAISREKQLKRWKKEWKLELIKKDNPEFKDLAENW